MLNNTESRMKREMTGKERAYSDYKSQTGQYSCPVWLGPDRYLSFLASSVLPGHASIFINGWRES